MIDCRKTVEIQGKAYASVGVFLLEYFKANIDSAFTVKHLINVTQVSDKTMRKYIKKMLSTGVIRGIRKTDNQRLSFFCILRANPEFFYVK